MEKIRNILIVIAFFLSVPYHLAIGFVFRGVVSPWLKPLLDIADVAIVGFTLMVLAYLAFYWYKSERDAAQWWRIPSLIFGIFTIVVIGGLSWPFIAIVLIWVGTVICLLFVK